MKVSEDRFPLLFVYLEDQEEQLNARARTVSRGAAEIIGRWPQYVTFASYMSMIGLLSLFLCFVISLFVLSLAAPEHNPRRFPVIKCERDDTKQAYRLNHFDRLVNTENATFIVDVFDEVNNTSCAVESYLNYTNLPVYHIRLTREASPDPPKILTQLQKKFSNYKIITAGIDSFLKGTTFADFRNATLLKLISKVLISWNFGGVVIDSNFITVSDHRDLVSGANKSVVVGLSGSEIILLASRNVCHSFVFGLMKKLTKDVYSTQAELVHTAYKDFCINERMCSSIELVSEPYFCVSDEVGCVFMDSRRNSSAVRGLWGRVCPLTNSYS